MQSSLTQLPNKNNNICKTFYTN